MVIKWHGEEKCGRLCFSKMAIAIFPVSHTLPETCHSPWRDTVYNLSPCTWAALCASTRGWQKACDFQGWVINSDVASTWFSLSGSQPLCSYEAHMERNWGPQHRPQLNSLPTPITNLPAVWVSRPGSTSFSPQFTLPQVVPHGAETCLPDWALPKWQICEQNEWRLLF